ncbi:MAG: sigma 54-interacting transcriptional regulator [Bacteroidales bacterium]|nr:sigma 54-interacting transcriptional regulator [Bacteroidales bacterium]
MKNIYITFHYTTHGIAYLKHILSAFSSGKCKVDEDFINVKNISQIEMNNFFDTKKNGFQFDEIYYLTTDQEVFDKISARRFNYRYLILTDETVIKQKTQHIWENIIENEFANIEQEIEYVRRHFPNYDKLYESQIWRDIQHYKIEDQIYWFKKHSNVPTKTKNNFNIEKLKIKNLRDTKEIANNLILFIDKLKKKHSNSRWIINVSLGSNETQVAWQILAQSEILPINSKLINTYDNKNSIVQQRFKEFDIKEVSKKIISEISSKIKVYETPVSEVRQLADAKMRMYIKSGFSVLLLGERGIGKTHLAEKIKEKDQKFVSVNCASFSNNTIAESILFGYKKGAFTDAKEDRQGVFEQANNGILFLDEIHHLDKLTQAKLMKAIETDSNNYFTIKRLGDSNEQKIRTSLIFASNKKISELRNLLLPDFYDRITQLVIEIPPLRASRDDLKNDLKAIWQQMRFEEFYSFDIITQNDKKLFDWLKTLNLYGNYRDLQKISIYYKTFHDFDKNIKKALSQKSAYEFTKNEFEKYISKEEDQETLFDISKSPFELVKIFQRKLAEYLINNFGSAQKTVDFYKNKGEKLTERTLYNWKK